jgi:hypothetical protein
LFLGNVGGAGPRIQDRNRKLFYDNRLLIRPDAPP